MQQFAHYIQTHIRPRSGWLATILAFCAVMMPAAAAAQSSFGLRADAFVWAGLLGVLIGIDSVPRREWQAPQSVRWLRLVLHGAVWLLGVPVFVAWAGEALPPLGLLLSDMGVLLARARGDAPDVSAGRSVAFVWAALARLGTDLAAAPANGARGATLLLNASGVALTWLAGLCLGRGLVVHGQFFVFVLPLLVTLALVAVIGDGGGGMLAIGCLAIVLLVAVVTFRRRLVNWDQGGVDYSTELGQDVFVWTALVALLTLLAAWIVPLWPGNPLAMAFQRNDSPSGIAALDRGISRPVNPNPTVDVGLSTLPTVPLGVSLQEGPAGQISLRIRVEQPLPGGAWPRYWRARVLNHYTGSGWYADARINPQDASDLPVQVERGQIVQDVEDLREDRSVVIGLPDIQQVNIATTFEYFADGAQAAITARPPTPRYRVLSRVQELAPAPPIDREPPDMAAYRALPANLPNRVGILASTVAGDKATTLAQALALEEYLRAQPYQYQVEAIPPGGDAVDQFLFEMRSGYCTYYASAMAIMARSLRIPARVAVGYATGEEVEPGVYVVREADAHAWPELYIDGRWLPFEPTPIRPLPARTPADEAAPAPVAEVAPQPDRVQGPLIWIAVIGGLVGLGVALWRMGRKPPPPTPVVRALAALERCGERFGIAWPDGATIQEYGSMLERQAGEVGPALRELVAIVQRARYGAHQLEADEQRRLLAAEQQLDQAVPHMQR